MRFRHPESVIVQLGKDTGFHMGRTRVPHDMELVPVRDALAMSKMPTGLLDFWLLTFVAPHKDELSSLETAFTLEARDPGEEAT